jgi:hypothetical protein
MKQYSRNFFQRNVSVYQGIWRHFAAGKQTNEIVCTGLASANKNMLTETRYRFAFKCCQQLMDNKKI